MLSYCEKYKITGTEKRERQRERDRQTDRDTERETETDRDRQTERYRHTDRHTDRQAGRHRIKTILQRSSKMQFLRYGVLRERERKKKRKKTQRRLHGKKLRMSTHTECALVK